MNKILFASAGLLLVAVAASTLAQTVDSPSTSAASPTPVSTMAPAGDLPPVAATVAPAPVAITPIPVTGAATPTPTPAPTSAPVTAQLKDGTNIEFGADSTVSIVN